MMKVDNGEPFKGYEGAGVGYRARVISRGEKAPTAVKNNLEFSSRSLADFAAIFRGTGGGSDWIQWQLQWHPYSH